MESLAISIYRSKIAGNDQEPGIVVTDFSDKYAVIRGLEVYIDQSKGISDEEKADSLSSLRTLRRAERDNENSDKELRLVVGERDTERVLSGLAILIGNYASFLPEISKQHKLTRSRKTQDGSRPILTVNMVGIQLDREDIYTQRALNRVDLLRACAKAIETELEKSKKQESSVVGML